jgi:hypothetical protein
MDHPGMDILENFGMAKRVLDLPRGYAVMGD